MQGTFFITTIIVYLILSIQFVVVIWKRIFQVSIVEVLLRYKFFDMKPQ
jgi:uncharacterized membrane protein